MPAHFTPIRTTRWLTCLQGALPPETFRDKIVLVGGTALGIGDLRNTPFQKQDAGYMGVEVHANILDNLLHSTEPHRTFLIRGVREELIDVGFIVLFGVVLGMWFGRTRPLVSTVTSLIILAVFVWFVYYSFAHWGRWLSLVIPAITLIGSYASITSFRVIFEEREKRKIRKTFGQYLSPGVIGLIEKDPQKYIRPGGEEKELTVMFSDIRDFTTLSEGLTAERTGAFAKRISGRDDGYFVRKPGYTRQVHRRRDHGLLGLALSAGGPRVSRLLLRIADGRSASKNSIVTGLQKAAADRDRRRA